MHEALHPLDPGPIGEVGLPVGGGVVLELGLGLGLEFNVCGNRHLHGDLRLEVAPPINVVALVFERLHGGSFLVELTADVPKGEQYALLVRAVEAALLQRCEQG